jgi:phospholipid/cholesterol/gamma-HCH transport system substrate-binding protein
VKRAIKNHLVDFIAIIVLIVLAIVVSGFILTHERLPLPFVSSSTFTINADFSSAKAVTPGQGQTVNVSGVQVGSVSGVKLSPDGVAEVSMSIDSKWSHLIHTDATALIRPRTGLDDMFIELNPGTKRAPVAKQGFTIPVSNTNPVVDPDQILSSLDADTREYLELLINGAGPGLQKPGGSELAKLLQRFLPTHRDLARLNSVVAQRGAALQSLIHNLQVLNTAVATKRTQVAQLIDTSSKVFRAFANANQGISSSVAQLPGVLTQATATLQKVQRFANLLGPTTRSLLPAVGAIPAANRATIALAKPITPVLQHQIRPFVIAARPLVRNLRPASINLAKATPDLSKTFKVLNSLFNLLGYHPGGGQHGYLWWLAWGDHDARTLFSVQDANGDFRPLFLQASCASLAQIAQDSPSAQLAMLILNLTPLLSNTHLCPAQHGAKGIAQDMRIANSKNHSSSSSSGKFSSSSSNPSGGSSSSSSASPSSSSSSSSTTASSTGHP